MKKYSLLIALIIIGFIGNAQTELIAGSWLITKVEVEGEIEEPCVFITFKENGQMEIMGIEAGSWKYNKSKNAIVMKSDLDKDFSGDTKILTITNKEMVASKDGVTIYYTKIDEAEIAKNNEASALEGTWKITDPIGEGQSQILKMELPDSFVLKEIQEGSEATIMGTWIFNPEEETLIMIGFSELLSGENTIIAFDSEQLILENSGTRITAEVEKTESNKIERLSFTEQDFFTEEGDYKYYDDEGRLPWQDPYEMMMKLANIQHLVYNYAVLVNDTEVFTNKTLTADVEVYVDEPGLSIDFIFYGYDNYDLPDDTELPPNYYDISGYSIPLYPLRDDNPFRIAGTEEITTPTGTFDCTVIEVAGSFDRRQKLWMINDMPGIYAKIIEDKEGSFGHHIIYELQEIK